MIGGFSQLKAIWRSRRKIARRGILAALLMTTLLAGGCAYNGYYADNWPYYPQYGGYYRDSYPQYGGYYPYSYPYYGGYYARSYPYYGGHYARSYPYYGGHSGGHHGKHSGGHSGGHHGGHH